MRTRITDDILRKANRPAQGQTFIWDDLVDGFGARLTPNAVAFVIKTGGGNRSRKTFAAPADAGATHGWRTLSAQEARKEAQSLLITHGAGAPESEPLAAAMTRWAHAKEGKPRYRASLERITAVWIAGEPLQRGEKTPAEVAAVKALGEKAITQVTRADALKLFDAMRAAGRKGVGEQVWAYGSAFYGWAIERELATVNPFRNRLRLMGGRSVRRRKYDDPELLTLWNAFKLEGYPAFPAFALLAYTGTRRSEVTKARWQEFNLDAGTWIIPAERAKNGVEHTIALAPSVIKLLKAIPRTTSEYVFVGGRDGRAFDFHHALRLRINERAASVQDWRLHDLRRSMRSGLAKLGVSQVVAELCLNHITVRSGITGVYDQHDYSPECARAWKLWAAHLDKLTGAKKR